MFGDYGFVDYMLRGLGGSTADDAHDIDVISSFESSPNLGGDDTITAGAATTSSSAAPATTPSPPVRANLAFGDNARLARTRVAETTSPASRCTSS